MLHKPDYREASSLDPAQWQDFKIQPQSGAPKERVDRVHGGVALSVLAIFTYMFLVIAVTFASDAQASFMVVISAVYTVMYFGTPIVMTRIGGIPFFDGTRWSDYLDSTIDTYTGPLTGRQIWQQICMIPGALALATTGICLIIAATS